MLLLYYYTPRKKFLKNKKTFLWCTAREDISLKWRKFCCFKKIFFYLKKNYLHTQRKDIFLYIYFIYIYYSQYRAPLSTTQGRAASPLLRPSDRFHKKTMQDRGSRSSSKSITSGSLPMGLHILSKLDQSFQGLDIYRSWISPLKDSPIERLFCHSTSSGVSQALFVACLSRVRRGEEVTSFTSCSPGQG